MKVKRYEARTMQEAIMMVKAEMGRDAVILHSKKIRKGGVLGLFGKPAFEVIAAISPEDQPKPIRRGSANEAAATKGVIPGQHLNQLELASLQQEIMGMKEVLASLNTSLTNAPISSTAIPGHLQSLYTLLLQQGVADKYIRELVAQMASLIVDGEGQLWEQARSVLSDAIRVPGVAAASASPRVVALIGPTGVGKTTTIAKLAAQYAIFDGLDVGLITADTYRIAAVEQLKTYAEIIGVPLEVVFSIEEVTAAKDRLAQKDVILVDTAGRSQKNEEQLAELLAYLHTVQASDVALVLSATTESSGMVDCLGRFKPCGYNQLIFTKLDEAISYGPMYSALRDAGLPLTHLTFGQNVPDDIRPGDPDYVAQLLLADEEKQ